MIPAKRKNLGPLTRKLPDCPCRHWGCTRRATPGCSSSTLLHRNDFAQHPFPVSTIAPVIPGKLETSYPKPYTVHPLL